MRRTTSLQRSRTPLRRTGRLRAQSARRRADQPAYQALKADLVRRAGGRCEVPWCRRRTSLDLHHVVKRSRGGALLDPANCVVLDRGCHERTDRPESDPNWLGVEAVGDEEYVFAQHRREFARSPGFERAHATATEYLRYRRPR